ncbi:MAG: hypothetical protein LBM75_08130 [Myxococcales bacterium]|jgi:hypothetical protein|nr:hypothetical protein [Myxococcales bacterium]
MKNLLNLVLLAVMLGCQNNSYVEPNLDYSIHWSGPPADKNDSLSLEIVCSPISINALHGPRVECCPLDGSYNGDCPPCPFAYSKRNSFRLEIEPSISEVAISGEHLIIFPEGPAFYLPGGKITPEVKEKTPWIKSVYRKSYLISFIYVARRCLERTLAAPHLVGACSKWGEEEEFEQGFICD